MSATALEQINNPRDAAPIVSDTMNATAAAAHSPDGQKLYQAALSSGTDTAQAHLPKMELGYEHTTGKNGEDEQTWRDASGRVTKTEEKDQKGNDTTRNFTYDQKTGNITAESTLQTDKNQHITYDTARNYDAQTGQLTFDGHYWADGSSQVKRFDSNTMSVTERDAHGTETSSTADANTGRVTSSEVKYANHSGERKEFDLQTGKMTSDTKTQANGSSSKETISATGKDVTTLSDRSGRVTSVDIKDGHGNELTRTYDPSSQAEIMSDTKYADGGSKHMDIDATTQKVTNETIQDKNGNGEEIHRDRVTGAVISEVQLSHGQKVGPTHAQAVSGTEPSGSNYQPGAAGGVQAHNPVAGRISLPQPAWNAQPGGGVAYESHKPGPNAAARPESHPIVPTSVATEQDYGNTKTFYSVSTGRLAAIETKDSAGQDTLATLHYDHNTGNISTEQVTHYSATGKNEVDTYNFDPVTQKATSEDVVNADGSKKHIDLTATATDYDQ